MTNSPTVIRWVGYATLDDGEYIVARDRRVKPEDYADLEDKLYAAKGFSTEYEIDFVWDTETNTVTARLRN